MSTGVPVERFPSLSAIPFVRHGFTGRVPGLDVATDRESALRRLAPAHFEAQRSINTPIVFAEQVHGAQVAVVRAAQPEPVAGVDGLITDCPDIGLGIYVADCCAIFLVDPKRRAIGLLHSGRKGTELGIATRAIEAMTREFGCEPAHMVVQLSPCIRPPHFETDFASQIVAQCAAAGVKSIFDSGLCTATHSERYYSYRAELGKTGRMLALLSLLG